MAEVIGITASALQIADTALKFKKLYSDIKHASRDLRCLAEEVAVLATMLGDVEKFSTCNLTANSPGWEQCFNLFKSSAESMTQTTTELEKTLESHRATGSIRLYLRKDELDRCKDRLERTKGTMMLAQQAYSCAILTQQNETILHEIRAVAMCQQLYAVTLSTNTNGTSLQRFIDDNEPRDDNAVTGSNQKVLQFPQRRLASRKALSSYNLRIPSWILSKGLQVLVHRSNQSWGITFRSYNQVSSESEIFRLARTRAWDQVRNLLDLGKASPWDIDSNGSTLLHVAAEQYDTRACAFLLDIGLDPSYCTNQGNNALRQLGSQVYIDMCNLRHERCEVIDTISLLLSSPHCLLERDNVSWYDLTGFSPNSLSLLINAITPAYATLDKLSRAILACGTFTLDAEAVMLKLGPDLTLHQAFDKLLGERSAVNHYTLLLIASAALAFHFALPHQSQTAVESWEAIVVSIIKYDCQSRSLIAHDSALLVFVEAYCIASGSFSRNNDSRASDWNSYFTNAGRIWISLLQRLGADLLQYGKTEKVVCVHNAFGVIDVGGSSIHLAKAYAFSFRNLVYGPEVSDWFLYCVPVATIRDPACAEYAMAGRFWDWVENPELYEMPGAFIVDDEDPVDDSCYVMIEGPIL